MSTPRSAKCWNSDGSRIDLFEVRRAVGFSKLPWGTLVTLRNIVATFVELITVYTRE